MTDVISGEILGHNLQFIIIVVSYFEITSLCAQP